MIIKNKRGEKLELSDQKLTQIDYPYDGSCSRYLLLRELREVLTLREKFVTVFRVNDNDACPVDLGKNRIGCCLFSPATFAKILKAAGIKPVRKTNKPAKGKK